MLECSEKVFYGFKILKDFDHEHTAVLEGSVITTSNRAKTLFFVLYRQPKIQKAVTETELFPPGL